MSKDGDDLYKAAIGAPDNFMSTYYHTEFKKLDEARKKERERQRQPNASYGLAALNSSEKKKIDNMQAANASTSPQEDDPVLFIVAVIALLLFGGIMTIVNLFMG